MPSRRSASIDRLLDAFNARDFDAWMAEVTEDFEMHSRFSSVAATVFRGLDGVRAWWDDLADVWGRLDLVFEDSGDISAERTVLLMTLRGTGRGSALRLDEPIAQRWYWRGERVAKIEYVDRREAELIVSGGQPQ